MSNPDIKLEAGLDVSMSRKKIKEDVKKLGNINVPLTGKLNMQKTRAQIKKQTSGENLGTVNLNTNINTKNITSSVSKATSQTQKQMSAKPLTFSINKDKLINDIKILGQQNSRLFKDVGMTTKYNQLLDSAKLATSTKDLKILRMSLSAFKSELKATGNAGLTMGDALKKGLTRATELFGSYGLIMMFSRQLRNAWTEARELDASLTDLAKVNDEITRSDFPEYLEKCISKTKELAVATKDYIEAVTTFSRAGYNLADSEILTEKATQLANVGDMSAEDASKTILSGIQAYNEIDGYGIEQLEEKAQALNDKLNEIGNTASISTSELAEGIQAVGSVMNDANTSIDEFIALLGAGNRQVQDSKKVSLAIRTSALRIRSCTTELEEMGEETEGVITSTSELADKIKALTDIDGVGKLEGVSILEADGKTFRSIFDIYNDISKVYDKMDDTDSSALLKLISGTHRSSQVSAILNNMAEANEILNNSLNATGSASEEYSKYLESAEAATTRFGVAMTDAYNSVLNGNTVKALANTGTAILDFANKFGLVESTLRGLIAIGVLKGIGTLTTAIKGSVVQVTNLGSALNTVKNLNNLTRGTQQYANAMNILKVSCVGLTDAQLKQVLSNTSLTQSERIKILQYQGLTKAQAQAKLTQLGLTQATNQQTTANTMATTSTLSFKNAITGLGASIKSAFLSNPIGWIIMGISTAVSITTSAINKYKEELREVAEEASKQAEESADYIKNLIDLQTQLKEGTTSTEDLTTAFREQLRVMGYTETEIDNLIAKYGNLSGAINEATREALENAKTDASTDVATSSQALEKASSGGLVDDILIEDYGTGNKELDAKIADILSKVATKTAKQNTSWVANDHSAEGLYAYYQALQEVLRLIQETASETNNQDLLNLGNAFDTTTYGEITEAINKLKESAELYGDAISRLHNADAQLELSDYLKTNDIDSQETFDSYIDGIKNSTEYSEVYKQVLISVANDAFPQFSAAVKDASDGVSNFNSKINASTTLSNVQSLSKGLDQLGKIYLDIKDKGSFDFSSILNNDDFAEQFNVEGLTKEYNAFIETVTKNPKDIKACQSAFDDLATAYINNKFALEGVTSATKEGTIAMLKQMGIANAEEIVEKQLKINRAKLSAQKIIDANATEDLTNKTADEITALLNEADASDIVRKAFIKLVAEQDVFNNAKLNNGQKLESLKELAKGCGIVVAGYEAAFKASKAYEEAMESGKNISNAKRLADEAYKKYIKNWNKQVDKDFKFSSTDFDYKAQDKNSSSSSKSTAETFDWIETKIERLQRKVEKFKEKASNPFESWEIRDKNLTKQIKKLNKLSETQEKASDKYLKKANNVNLSESYKKKVRNGTIDIESIKNENTKNKIEKYQKWYNKYLESLDAEKDIQNQLQESYREQFDLISAKYDAEVALIENSITDLENAIELAEAKGKEISGSYYNGLISNEKKHISELEKEYNELNNKLKSYKGSKDSEEYKDLVNEIDQVKQAWDEAKISLENYEQAQKEADWEIFDRKQQKTSDTANDNSFILGLIEDEDMYDENGNITNYGQTANGLHIANIGLYTKQAKEYADEIAKLDREYANNKTNTYYLERRRELVEAQQDSINSIEDEKQALIDLAKDGYDSLLKSMQKIIDKRKEALNQIKSLYDYEKSIRESTDEISVIQKQLIAYQGDNSEESQSTIQQLQESLKDAEENLQEKQMDRYIQEQEQLYDKLMDDTQTWVDGLFQNEATLLQGIIDGASKNTTAILSLIQQVASAAGYDVSVDQLTSLQGYASGSSNIPYNQMNWVHSDELIYRASDGGLLMPLGSGDKVFTKEMSDRLWDMAQIGFKPILPSMSNITPVQRSGDVSVGDINITFDLPNVQNYSEFMHKMQRDSKFQGMIWEMVYGKNSLGKYKYNWK